MPLQIIGQTPAIPVGVRSCSCTCARVSEPVAVCVRRKGRLTVGRYTLCVLYIPLVQAGVAHPRKLPPHEGPSGLVYTSLLRVPFRPPFTPFLRSPFVFFSLYFAFAFVHPSFLLQA